MQDQQVSLIPVNAHVSPDVFKAVGEVMLTMFDKIRGMEPIKQTPPLEPEQPKSWFLDPNEMFDSTGLGYKVEPNILTYETQRAFSEKNTIVGSVLKRRLSQLGAFCRPQENKHSVGFKIRPLHDPDRALTQSETERINEITQIFLWTGQDKNLGRDSLITFVQKLVRDSLTYDQACFEKVFSRRGRILSFHAIDGSSVRIATPKIAKDTPPHIRDLKKDVRYVQLVDGEIQEAYTVNDLAFLVRNPRTHLRVGGYGFSEIEMLLTTLTAHMWAEQWNRNAFRQGSTIKGVFNIQNAQQNTLDMFRRQWQTQVAGVDNAHKLPVIGATGAQFIPMQLSNTEMGYQMWMEYLIKIICAFYLIDPSEINFDLRGAAGAAPVFQTNNESQQKNSKDQGLGPLLHFVEDAFNRHLMPWIDDRFKFMFVGLDAKTEEQNIELREKQSQTILTLNEARALEGLPPLKHGNIPLSAVYTSYLRDKSMQQQQGAQGGMPQVPGMPQQGGDGDQAQGQDAFEQQFGSAAPGEPEQQARDVVNNFGKKPASNSSDSGNVSHSSDSVDHPIVPHAFRENDWESVIHSSMPQATFFKSTNNGQLFDQLEIE